MLESYILPCLLSFFVDKTENGVYICSSYHLCFQGAWVQWLEILLSLPHLANLRFYKYMHLLLMKAWFSPPVSDCPSTAAFSPAVCLCAWLGTVFHLLLLYFLSYSKRATDIFVIGSFDQNLSITFLYLDCFIVLSLCWQYKLNLKREKEKSILTIRN